MFYICAVQGGGPAATGNWIVAGAIEMEILFYLNLNSYM